MGIIIILIDKFISELDTFTRKNEIQMYPLPDASEEKLLKKATCK